MRRRSAVALVMVLTLVAVTCKRNPGTAVPVPTTVTLSPVSFLLAALAATQQLTATVRDQNGAVMTGVGITWSSDNGLVATVNSSGLVTAAGNGGTTIRAAAGAIEGTATVTVAQAVTQLLKLQGDGQTGTVNTALPVQLIVRANDANGNPVANVAVTLAVTQGGGSLGGTAGATGTNGQTAPVTWTLGTTAGTAHQATASASGAPSAAFAATAQAGPAASAAIQAGNGQTGPSGLALPIDAAVIVRDQFANAVANVGVSFAATLGGGSVNSGAATTGSNGVATVGDWILGAPGPNELTATVTGSGITGNPVVFSATATAAGAPASVAVFAGNNQTGLAGFALNTRPAVIVRDAAMAPVPNVTVDYAVTSGGGNVTGASVLTGADGVARVGSWTVQLGANTVSATVQAAGVAGNPVSFAATGAAQAFNIDVRFLTAVSAGARAAFDSAEARWERMLYGELSDIALNVPAGTCAGVSVPAVNETVDDLLIFVRLDSIDGPLNQLGSAGPCRIRTADTLPVLGAMRFDTADVATFLAQGLFDEIVMHEMGHVLGFGTLWPLKSLIVGPSQSGGPDPHFVGPAAIAAFDANGGAGYGAGAKVPVENTGGAGTADGHWRESVFDRELMTGFLDGGVTNPLSVISIASLADVGYLRTNNAAAEAYVVANPLSLHAGGGPKISLGRDIAWGPLVFVDAAGRVRGTWVPR